MTTYQYKRNQLTAAVILNYYVPIAPGDVAHAVDSTRCLFSYTDNESIVTQQDSVWDMPCFTNGPCFAQFGEALQTQRRYDANGNLLLVNRSAGSPVSIVQSSFTNKYTGPDGSLS